MVHMKLGEMSPGGVGVGPERAARLGDPVGVHRRAHGRANTGVPRQEDPGRRGEARRDLHPGHAGGRARLHRGLDVRRLGAATRSIFNPGAHGFSELIYAFTSAGNNNGSAFAGHHRRTPVDEHHAGARDAVRPLLPDHPDAGARRLAGPQAARAAVGGHVPDRHAAVRRAGDRRDLHRRRAHVPARPRARPHRRAAQLSRRGVRSMATTTTASCVEPGDPAAGDRRQLRQAQPAHAHAQPGDVRGRGRLGAHHDPVLQGPQ